MDALILETTIAARPRKALAADDPFFSGSVRMSKNVGRQAANQLDDA
ncbi:MAG: hypothetical protein ACKV2V_21700 [Blastocatellia bacterium]